MIDSKDLEVLDERYVRKDVCSDHRATNSKEMQEIREGLAIIKTKVNILLGILGAIAVPVLAIAVKFLFER